MVNDEENYIVQASGILELSKDDYASGELAAEEVREMVREDPSIIDIRCVND